MNWMGKSWIFIAIFMIKSSTVNSFQLKYPPQFRGVDSLNGDATQQLIKKMKETKRVANGWGLNMEQYDQVKSFNIYLSFIIINLMPFLKLSKF